MTKNTKLKDYNNGYFSLKYYLDQLNRNWKTENVSLIFVAPRNIGKSCDIHEHFIFEEIWLKSNFYQKVVFLRNSESRLKLWRNDFNSTFGDRYRVSTDFIIYKKEFDENGKEDFLNEKVIGYGIGLNNPQKYLSAKFENVRMIFWDEFNENCNMLDVFQKWITIFKTIERFNNPFLVVLAGNKNDGVNNDILINLEIEAKEVNDYSNKIGEDVLIQVSDSIYFVNVCEKTYEGLGNKDTSSNEWAKFNASTNSYLNDGGYIKELPDNVLVYSKKVAPTAKIFVYYTIRGYIFEYGSFKYKDKTCYYFREVSEKKEGYHLFALDLQSDMSFKNSIRLSDDELDLKDFALFLKEKIKFNELYYCSFNAKLILESYILTTINMFYDK